MRVGSRGGRSTRSVPQGIISSKGVYSGARAAKPTGAREHADWSARPRRGALGTGASPIAPQRKLCDRYQAKFHVSLALSCVFGPSARGFVDK